MNRFLPLSFLTFTRIVKDNGGLSSQGWKKLAPWLMKTIGSEYWRWIEIALFDRKIKAHVIEHPPIFILGFYRSGTTYLQQLLTQDKQFGYLNSYQTVMPEMMLSTEIWLRPILEFAAKISNQKNPVHRVPMKWTAPGEEDIAMTLSVDPLAAQWGYFFPDRMMEHFEKHVLFNNVSHQEIDQWKQRYLYLIKKISFANKGKQLVLKSPPNTARIKHLLSLFPNAKFVYIYRDPFEVYGSNKRLLKVVQENFALGKHLSADASSVILETYKGMIDAYEQQKMLVSDRNIVEVAYEDLARDPMNQMQRIYDHLGIQNFTDALPAIRAYVNTQRNYKVLQHQLTEQEQAAIINTWNVYGKAQ